MNILHLSGTHMGETINITTMAEDKAQEIFQILGWERTGPKNINWPCTKEANKTHPADAVYYYKEPYSNSNTYLLIDFKSYASSSITKDTIRGAVESLNEALSCAKVSMHFQDLYINSDKKFTIKAVLFIYNHDNKFDKDFLELMPKSVNERHRQKDNAVTIDQNNVICIIGPQKIKYLLTIANNIYSLRGRKLLPSQEHCGFFCPDDIYIKLHSEAGNLPLTIERLAAKTHIMRYTDDDGNIKGYDIYSESDGTREGYFLYLLDYLRKNNIFQDKKEIRIFLPFDSGRAAVVLQKAKQKFCNEVTHDFKDKIYRLVSIKEIAAISFRESALNEGMK